MEGHPPLGGVGRPGRSGRPVVGHSPLQFGVAALGLEGLGPVDQRRGPDPASLVAIGTGQKIQCPAQRLDRFIGPAGLGEGQTQVHQGRGLLFGRGAVPDQVRGPLEEGRGPVGPSQPPLAVAGRGADAGVLHRRAGLGEYPPGPIQQVQGTVKVAVGGLAAGHRHPVGGQRPPIGVAPGPNLSQLRLKPLQTHRPGTPSSRSKLTAYTPFSQDFPRFRFF